MGMRLNVTAHLGLSMAAAHTLRFQHEVRMRPIHEGRIGTFRRSTQADSRC